MKNKFSIIIPVYNVEQYLSKCLDSIINQTYKNLEIICINDGSRDNSLSILEAYANKDDRIKIINQENKGVSAARNAGIEAATGEYIFFADSDDYLDENAFKVLIKTIDKYPESELILFGFYDMVKNKLRRIRNENLQEMSFNLFEKSLYVYNAPALFCLWIKLFKTDILKQNNIRFDTDLNWGEDGLFIMQYYLQNPKTVSILTPLYYYNARREHSLSTNCSSKLFPKRKAAFDKLSQYFLSKDFNKDETIFITFFADKIMLETLSLWKDLYFSKFKKEYLLFINQIQNFYTEIALSEMFFKGYYKAKKEQKKAKYHLSALYWKILFPIGKYCFVLPYRKIKNFSKNIDKGNVKNERNNK